MYCDKCGIDNADDAAFCRGCGREFPEIATRVAVRKMPQDEIEPAAPAADHPDNSSDEAVIFSISPTLMFVKAGYVAAAIGALVLTAAFAAFLQVVWAGVFFGLCLFLIPAYFHLLRRLVRYTLTESKIEIDSGLIARTTRNVPLRRIQDVTVTANVAQRLLGFGDVVIDNASEQGGKVVLDNINSPQEYADKLLRQMRRLEN